jgi:hypothetical protein
MHGTGIDDCDYTPSPSNVTHSWEKVYNNDAKTNATYAV